MLNPRLPIRAGGVALLAIVFAQIFGWSDGVGFLFGWLLLAASLILPRLAPFAWARGQAAQLMLRAQKSVERGRFLAARWTVVARTRHNFAASPSRAAGGSTPPSRFRLTRCFVRCLSDPRNLTRPDFHPVGTKSDTRERL